MAMASIRKRNNRWEVRVRRIGYPTQTKTFTHKSSAQTWAREAELALEQGKLTCRPQRLSMTLEEAVQRYLAEVSIHHKGHDAERYRLMNLLERLGRTRLLAAITSKDIATLKTERLQRVSSGAVRRELNLLSSLFETAKNEWAATSLGNPVRAVKRPKDSVSRDRRLTLTERHQLLSKAARLANIQPYLAILIALETGMRQGEILKLQWDDIDLGRDIISVRDAKNGHNRQVVMSDRLAAHLATVQRTNDAVFQITSSGLQQAFRKLTRRLQMYDLRFHDLRHEAISTFFERGLTVPEVQLMSGRRTLDQLMRYAHATSQAVKSKINQGGATNGQSSQRKTGLRLAKHQQDDPLQNYQQR